MYFIWKVQCNAKNINEKEVDLKCLETQLILKQWTSVDQQQTLFLWDEIVVLGAAMAQGPLLYNTFSLNVNYTVGRIFMWSIPGLQELQCISVIRNCSRLIDVTKHLQCKSQMSDE